MPFVVEHLGWLAFFNFFKEHRDEYMKAVLHLIIFSVG